MGSTLSWLAGFCSSLFTARSSTRLSFSVLAWCGISRFWVGPWFYRLACPSAWFPAVDAGLLFVSFTLWGLGVLLFLVFARFMNLVVIAAHRCTVVSCFCRGSVQCCGMSLFVIVMLSLSSMLSNRFHVVIRRDER